MIRELKGTHSYSKLMLLLSILTFAFGLAAGLIGELFLPFAAGFLSALFLFEKPKSRFLSYIVPLLTVAICILVNGIYALISVEYIILALIITLCYLRSKSKAECSLYLTLTVALFILLSLYLGAASSIGDFAPESVMEHYTALYNEIKISFVNFVTESQVTLEDGAVQQIMTRDDALYYFGELSKMAVSIIAIVAFAISGVALKIFTATALLVSKNGILKTFAHFLPSNAVAYAYIISAIISIFAPATDLFGITLANITQILLMVFAYIGIKYVFTVAKISDRKTTVYLFLAAAIVLLPGVAFQVLSYLGAWITINTNNQLSYSSDK